MLRRVAANKNALGERRGMLSCSWIYEFTIMRDGQAVPLPARFSMLVTKRDGE
jgi:hypothetical protein